MYGGFSWGNPQLMTAQAAPRPAMQAQPMQYSPNLNSAPGGAPGWTQGSMQAGLGAPQGGGMGGGSYGQSLGGSYGQSAGLGAPQGGGMGGGSYGSLFPPRQTMTAQAAPRAQAPPWMLRY